MSGCRAPDIADVITDRAEMPAKAGERPTKIPPIVCNPSPRGPVYSRTKGARTGEPRRRGALPRIRHRAIRRSALARIPDVRGLARRRGRGGRVAGEVV